MMVELAAVGAITIPGYTLRERIGAGGFGVVYRAHHDQLKREVAIKVLNLEHSQDAASTARFLAEARVVSQLSHPGIVDLFELGSLADGRPYFVMELIHGDTLRAVLERRGRLPCSEALPILERIAEAIDAAHGAGILHRDLKPDNVFVLPDGRVKLIDFGLAKLTGTTHTTLTKSGTLFGTPAYMSPEQCRARATTAATDAYSFGVLAYHVLVGATPFDGDPLKIALHHLNDMPEAPSSRVAELGPRVDRVLLALMAKDPDQRPLPLAPAIASISEGVLPARARRPRRWVRPALAGVAVVIVGAFAFAVSRPASRSEPTALVSRHAATDDCIAPETWLVGAWDPLMRIRADGMFAAAGSAVAPAWRLLRAELDEYSATLAQQWVSACHSPDRDTEPLMYAQRLNCLDNMLLDLETVGRALVATDPRVTAEAYTGDSSLPKPSQCASEAVLRAAVQAPPHEQRAVVEKVFLDAQRIVSTALREANAPSSREFEAHVAMLRSELAQLYDIGAIVQASDTHISLINLLVAHARDAADTDDVRAELTAAIAKGTQLRADEAVARYWIISALLETDAGRRDAVLLALGEARAAAERAGHPLRLEQDLALVAVYVREDTDAKHARARFDDLDRLVHRADSHPTAGQELQVAAARTAMELSLGDGPRAIAAARKQLALATADWGPSHPQTVQAREILARALAGDQ